MGLINIAGKEMHSVGSIIKYRFCLKEPYNVTIFSRYFLY